MRSLARGFVAAAAVTLAVAAPAGAVVDLDDDTAYRDVDTRHGAVAPTGAQKDAVADLKARARFNDFGTPSTLIRDGGYLATGIAADDATQAAGAFVRDNLALFRLSSLDTLEVTRDAKLGDGHAVVFQQVYGDRPAAPDGVLTVAVEKAAGGWRVVYASSSLSGDETVSQARAAAAPLSAEEAWVASAKAVGVSASVPQLRSLGQKAGWTLVRAARPGLVRPVAFQAPERGAITAYETYVDRGDSESYRQIVDATTGDVLFRESATDHLADNPRWDVFPGYPHPNLDRYPWNYPSSDTRDVWCWTPTTACKLAVASTASKVEWDKDARTNQPTNTTIGNNARAGENWQNSNFPQANQYRPVSATRDYLFPWTNVWFETLCSPSNFTPGTGNDIDAAVTNLFAMHNRMHDWAYHLGFREDTWNAQDFNYGIRTEGERDPVIGDAQAGGVTGGAPTYSGRDNANMSTRPDGTSSWSNMYLWQPIAGTFYAPCVDGDYDMSVIGHEYGHMIENRMIGKGNRRAGDHAGAMGESAGDLMAMEYLNEWSFAPNGGGDHPVNDGTTTKIGTYVTSNDEHGIRNYDMAYPTAGAFPAPGVYPKVDPLNFSDVGYDITGPQVHADGEIWSATNFDTRELLLERYPGKGTSENRACANGERPAQECPGNRRWIQIMFDSFLLMPPRPTFLDARDAQLAADQMRFGGANQDLLWLSFARRGFGEHAATTDANDSEPTPDFESPLSDETTVTFDAVAKDEGRVPVQAKIYAGHYEARVSPIADTDPATTGGNLDPQARFVPDDSAGPNSGQTAYEFVAQARGYGHVRFRLNNLRPGEDRKVTIEFPTNWASRYKGATASGDGTRHDELIDDTESTNWESNGQPVEGRQVLIRLDGAKRFREVKASAMLLPAQPGQPPIPAQNRFIALRAFEVLACTEGADGANPTCDPSKPDGFKRIVKSQADAFPSVPARPVAPDLTLRTWSAPTTTATHVLFRVLSNQCTGQPAFQGEQDNDPANNTDCRVGGPLPPRGNDVAAAELELPSSPPAVIGAQAVK